MKAVYCALALGFAAAASATSAYARTTSKTISATVTIVSGNSVAAYVSGGSLTTLVQRGAPGAPAGPVPVLRIGFDLPASWFLVKRVTWDKPRKHLTIDF